MIKSSKQNPQMKHYTLEVKDDANPQDNALILASFDAKDNKEACTKTRALIQSLGDLQISGSFKVVRHKRVRVNCKSCCDSFREAESS